MSTWWQACVGRAVSRRTFLKTGVCSLALLALPPRAKAVGAPDPRQGFVNPQPALYYRALAGHKISCQLCPRACEVGPGDRGDCGVRENRQGRYLTLAYGNPCAVHVDPIEKKPFFHVLPGTPSFSLATAGCNLRCQFCQNYEISQARPEETYNMDLPPAQVVARARQAGCPSVAYTYVEPIIFFEYMLETSRLARQAGLLNTCHSAGYVSAAPLEELAQVLDAACIDLKAFDPGFYRELVDGELEPVLATLETLRRRGVHVEIVNLVIPRKNDDPGAITRMCRWIADELGPLTPLHFSRFYPLHKMRHHYPTPVSTLEQAWDLARKAGLKYVYIGNVPGHAGEDTRCHSCGKTVIARRGYRVGETHLKDGKCAHCGAAIPGIWRPRTAA